MTSATCILLMVGGGGQYTTPGPLPGTAFHDTYEKYDIKPCVLYRWIMENSGTLYRQHHLLGCIRHFPEASTLGVPTLVYFPSHCFRSVSVCGTINGWLGFGVFHPMSPSA